jgi:hypothetical protein
LGVNTRAWVGSCAALFALVLAACGPGVKTPALNTDQASALCAALDTAAQVKDLIFDQAEKQTPASNRLALTQLAKQASLRIASPLLDSYDEDAKKTNCSGTLHLTLPAGAVRNLGDTSDLTASIKYSSLPASDHIGVTYQVSGADTLISGVAGADITEWAARLTPNGMPAEGAPVPAAAPAPESAPPPAMATVTPPAAAPAAVVPAPQRPLGLGRRLPPVEYGGRQAPFGYGPPPLPRCQWARSYADRTICNDPALEAEDRRIQALFRNALAHDDTGEVRRTAQSERGAREGCQDRDCIEEWFRQREADLSPR